MKHLAPQLNLLPEQWHGCYDLGWHKIITKESFAHPAKFSRGLIERIFDYCLEKGWLHRGDTVGDCFGGIGTGGIVASYRGLTWIGCELEDKFVKLANANFEMHREALAAMGRTMPRIVQGDSRRFHARLPAGEVSAVITSPPFTQGYAGGGGINVKGYGDGSDKVGSRTYQGTAGDRPAGNIETLPAGQVGAVITSPPYSDITAGAGGLNTKPAKPGQQGGRNPSSASQNTDQRYGGSDGQISRLKGGDVDAVVTSPPWENNHEGSRKASKFGSVEKLLKYGRGHGASDSAVLAQAARDEQKTYGNSPGQIGNESKETYWQAMAQVYASCFKAIKPGGVLACVVKDYVSKGKRVPLCDDTARLLEHCGFTIVERVHAMLTKETRHGDLFTGETITTKSRKSFFRRLAEKKGSPPIDFEEVIFAQRP